MYYLFEFVFYSVNDNVTLPPIKVFINRCRNAFAEKCLNRGNRSSVFRVVTHINEASALKSTLIQNE